MGVDGARQGCRCSGKLRTDRGLRTRHARLQLLSAQVPGPHRQGRPPASHSEDSSSPT